ncbi:MAG: carboxypeptidase-like regulatory domain-containing protein [Terriglobus sp.]
MKQLTLQPGMVLALAALACSPMADAQSHSVLTASGSGMLTGVIRDAEGVPQMGALVEAVLPETGMIASAVTDARGRYRLNLRPGRYNIKATAALLMPAVREHLVLARGGRTVVDMTLSTLLAPSGWIPASRRTANEPSDDWMWTLRSSASRPMLRYADEKTYGVNSSDGQMSVSSSSQESRKGATGGSLTIKSSDGGFARGASHQILVLTRVDEHGSGSVLRADLSGPRTPYPVSPSAEVSVGFQRRTMLNGYTRTVLSYSGHPELTAGNGRTGLQGAVLRSAERLELGDTMRVDAGSVMREVNLGGNAVAMEPFLRVQAHGPGGLVIAYGMTRSRGTESIEDLDRVQAALPVAVMRNGHLRLETGSHHALSIARKLRGDGVVEVALYQDSLRNPLISGTGTLAAADIPSEGFIADPTTGTYRVAGKDYSSNGLRVSFRQPVTHTMNVGVEMVSGRALRAAVAPTSSMSDVLANLSAERMYAGTAFADGKILHTGTTLRASYRWQPSRTLTTVDAFRVSDDGAYLSCTVRQSLGRLPGLPQGLEAVVDLQNLLAEGYQPYLSSDGKTLYLAQTPRALQAGLSFTF